MRQPLPVDAGAALYINPGGKRFYHLSADCPCFKHERPQQIDIEQVRAGQMQPCLFCGYEPPPPPTRKERLVSVLAAPLGLLAWPAGILAGASGGVAGIVVCCLYRGGTLPLWASILVGAGIAGVGFWLDTRFGYIE